MSRRGSVWPTVLAVLAFVWASFSILSSGCMMAMMPLYSWMADSFEDALDEQHQAMMERMAELWWWWVAQGLIEFLLALLLIAAGIAIVKRTRRGVALVKLWSWLAILQVLLITPLNLILMGDAIDVDAAGPQLVGLVSGYASAAISIGLALILPVFYLIWFARGTIKREVTEW